MTLLQAYGSIIIPCMLLLLLVVGINLIGYFYFYRGPGGFAAVEADMIQTCSISLRTNDGVGYRGSIEYVRKNFGEKYVERIKQKLRELGFILPDDKIKKRRPSYLRLV